MKCLSIAVAFLAISFANGNVVHKLPEQKHGTALLKKPSESFSDAFNVHKLNPPKQWDNIDGLDQYENCLDESDEIDAAKDLANAAVGKESCVLRAFETFISCLAGSRVSYLSIMHGIYSSKGSVYDNRELGQEITPKDFSDSDNDLHASKGKKQKRFADDYYFDSYETSVANTKTAKEVTVPEDNIETLEVMSEAWEKKYIDKITKYYKKHPSELLFGAQDQGTKPVKINKRKRDISDDKLDVQDLAAEGGDLITCLVEAAAYYWICNISNTSDLSEQRVQNLRNKRNDDCSDPEFLHDFQNWINQHTDW